VTKLHWYFFASRRRKKVYFFFFSNNYNEKKRADYYFDVNRHLHAMTKKKKEELNFSLGSF
jgi:hypothetical protein